MGLFASLLDQFKALTPAALAGPLLLIPFIAAEQLRPLGRRPRFGDHGLNILVNFTTLYLSLPFADALPIFDILFGTYRRPAREEFPATGLGDSMPAPRSIWAAQLGPAVAAVRWLRPVRGGR